jgi:hypothetical protein
LVCRATGSVPNYPGLGWKQILVRSLLDVVVHRASPLIGSAVTWFQGGCGLKLDGSVKCDGPKCALTQSLLEFSV